MVDSIINQHNYDKYLIYQTMMQGDSLFLGENEDHIATFLFWLNKDTVFIKLFTKDFIYTTEKVINPSIFNYKFIKKLGVDENENNLKFVPPILTPFNSEVIIYSTNKEKFFFEYGYVSLYTENPNKHKYRKNFIEILRKEVKANIDKFKPERKYKREPLFGNK